MAAAADGLFADHGLDVELLDPAGGAQNSAEVAAGEAEFCLAREGWELVAPRIFTGVEPGSMDAARWEVTVGYTAGAYGLPAPDPASVCPELAAASSPVSRA